MSQTHDRSESELPRVEDLPVEETPAAAGGADDTEPEQGEGHEDTI